MQHDIELPMLAGIAACIRWVEELAALLSGPILTAGLAIALIDLLTDGKLLATTPALLFAWAASQTVGLDAQLVGSSAKLGRAIRQRAPWAILGYVLLVCALGYVAYLASDVFATQQAEGITTAQALARLGMDGATWIIQRSALAVVLVVLSGLLRYVAPAPAQISLADERDRLARELELEPLRQRLRAQQVGGWRAVAQTALQGAGMAQSTQTAIDAPAPFEASQQPPTATQGGAQAVIQAMPDRSDVPTRPPTGPGSPASKPSRQTRTAAANVTPMRSPRAPAPRRDRKTAARANARSGKRGSAEARVRTLLEAEPGIAFDELVRRAKVSESTASKWSAVVAAERTAAATQLAQ